MKQYKNMFVYSVLWEGEPSFKMLPMDNECPYVEVVYDPIEKTLAVISKNPIYSGTVKQHYEYYITDPEQIISFVNSFASNNTTDALNPIFNSLPS